MMDSSSSQSAFARGNSSKDTLSPKIAITRRPLSLCKVQSDQDIDKDAPQSRRAHMISFEIHFGYATQRQHVYQGSSRLLREFSTCFSHFNHGGGGKGSGKAYPITVAAYKPGEMKLVDILAEYSVHVPPLRHLAVRFCGENPKDAFKPTWQTETIPNTEKPHVHHRLLTHLNLLDLSAFRGSIELVKCLCDCIRAHQQLYEAGHLHGHIEPNSVLMALNGKENFVGNGYLYDCEPGREYRLQGFFDMTKLISEMPLIHDMLPELSRLLSDQKKGPVVLNM